MAKITVDTQELRIKLDAYLRRVKSGETVVITEGGKPVGEIMPARAAMEKRIKAFVNSGAADWNGRRYRPRRPSVHNHDAIQISDLVAEDRKR
jgi:prevent-host-death family protein